MWQSQHVTFQANHPSARVAKCLWVTAENIRGVDFCVKNEPLLKKPKYVQNEDNTLEPFYFVQISNPQLFYATLLTSTSTLTVFHIITLPQI